MGAHQGSTLGMATIVAMLMFWFWSSKRLNVITVGPTYVSFLWNFKEYDAANPNESEMIGHV